MKVELEHAKRMMEKQEEMNTQMNKRKRSMANKGRKPWKKELQVIFEF